MWVARCQVVDPQGGATLVSSYDVLKHVLDRQNLPACRNVEMLRLRSAEIRVNSTLAHKTVGARNLSFWLVKQDDQPCYVLVG